MPEQRKGGVRTDRFFRERKAVGMYGKSVGRAVGRFSLFVQRSAGSGWDRIRQASTYQQKKKKRLEMLLEFVFSHINIK
jgi:hypothetical protein